MTRMSRRVALALALQFVTFAAAAQTAAEFGRASAGEISLLPKASRNLSGTLGINLTEDVFGNRRGYELSAGGTLLKDRLWFFAAGIQQEPPSMAMPNVDLASAAGAQLRGQLGDAHDFSAFFASERVADAPLAAPQLTPQTFLSLRYTGVVTDNMFFTATYSGVR